jgi:large subunit ribosomal protein L5
MADNVEKPDNAGKPEQTAPQDRPEKQNKGDKQPKAEKQAKHDKGEKQKAKGGGKPEGGDKKDKGKKPAERPRRPKEAPRLLKRYREEIIPNLMKEFSYSSKMQVPRLSKITLNMGLGEAVTNPNIVKTAVEELTQIAGQRAVITRSKKSIANFKLRAGLAIGCRVTLRRWEMWEFLDRFVNVAIPRVRDFKGVSAKAFDGRGNYSVGIREQIIFPEIDYDKVEKIKGLNVTITTTARTDEEGKALLKHLGMPFRA